MTKQPRAAIQPMAIPARRFSHLHLDLVGPLPRSAEGYNHILTIVDRSYPWLDGHSTLQHNHSSHRRHFVAGWVARFGVPEHITSDRGLQFCSEVWAQLTLLAGADELTRCYPKAGLAIYVDDANIDVVADAEGDYV